MTDVFISYSRKDSDFTRRLTNELEKRNQDVWIDWQDIPRGSDWLNEIYTGIESANIFLLIVSQHSLTSQICNDEIAYARRVNKRIVPIIRENIEGDTEKIVKGTWLDVPWQDTARANWDAVKHINWLVFNEDTRFDSEFQALIKTLDEDLPHRKAHTRYLVRALDWERGARNPSFLMIGDEIATAEKWLLESGEKQPPPDPLHREYIAASRKAEDDRHAFLSHLTTRTRQFRLASAILGFLSLIALFVMVISALTARNALSTNATVEYQATYFSLEQRNAQTQVAGVGISANHFETRTPEAFIATMTQVSYLNSWTPITNKFNGVEMVKVPSGCFVKGSILFKESQPVREVCFENPFWIDRYEVTNEQFELLGGTALMESHWADSRLPRTNVSWFEAKEFCEDKRQSRLPNQMEWEYAARGPNSLQYPWGNDFVSNNAVFAGNSGGKPVETGSKINGISWVGAYDLSGNVWEWMDLIYFQSYFQTIDGEIASEETYMKFAVRGGGWGDIGEENLHLAYQVIVDPNTRSEYWGFRCVLRDTA